MNGMAPRVAGWAALAAAAVTAVAGCMTYAGNSSQVSQQASLISTLIGNDMGMGQMTEAGLIYVVQNTSEGYVSAITRSGRAGTPGERTVVHAVLGVDVTSETGSPPGLGWSIFPTVLCYRFTVGYYPYQIWQAQESCPQGRPSAIGGYAAMATAQAARIYSGDDAILKLPKATQDQVRTAPVSLSRAAHLLGLDRHARRVAGLLPLTARQFAAGNGHAALALRLRAGGCIYLSLPDDPEGSGLPGPWLSPVHAPCTGAAALAASGWISVNPAAGG